MGAESFQKNMEKGLIEVAPLAYMRGRTLDNAFIILDEAQNTTQAQMKMFLTRVGFGSKVVTTGDETQKDLAPDVKSGLEVAEKVLGKVEGISFCRLTSRDVVRHPLVQKIVTAYEEYEKKAVRKKRGIKMTLNLEDEYGLELGIDYEGTASLVISQVLEEEGCPYEAEVNLLLTSNEEIHRMNREYRDVDRPTDVLSFPQVEYERSGGFFLGGSCMRETA